MWNAEWEYRNQETLKQWYDEQQGRGGVRKIICFGCGNVFYTQIESKKYCWNGTCGRLGNYKLQRLHRLEQRKDLVCAGCGKTFTPKRSDAKYCSNTCRQRAYRKRNEKNGVGQNGPTQNYDVMLRIRQVAKMDTWQKCNKTIHFW